jgi:hypothetical protein
MSASKTRSCLREREGRIFQSQRRIALKAAPRPPPMAATPTMNGDWSIQSWFPSTCTFVNTMMPRPAPLPLLSENDITNAAQIAAMKQRQATLRLQNDDASSIENSTPPIGAPNAACSHKAAWAPAAGDMETHARQVGHGCRVCLRELWGAARMPRSRGCGR